MTYLETALAGEWPFRVRPAREKYRLSEDSAETRKEVDESPEPE